MPKFKVGDKVRRTNGSWCGVKPGDVGVVSSVDGQDLRLVDRTGVFSVRLFELVIEKPLETLEDLEALYAS